MKATDERKETENPGSKKPYTRPALTNYGAIEELTQGSTSFHNDPGGPFSGKFEHP